MEDDDHHGLNVHQGLYRSLPRASSEAAVWWPISCAGKSDMLHSGGDCQAEPNLLQPHFGNFGQVLTTERVQTDLTPCFGCLLPCWFCESRRCLQRAGLANLTQMSVGSCSGGCLPPELCLSCLSKHRNHPHTGFLHPSNHVLQPFLLPQQ